MKCDWCQLGFNAVPVSVDHFSFCSDACANLYRDYCRRLKAVCRGEEVELNAERIASLLREKGHDH